MQTSRMIVLAIALALSACATGLEEPSNSTGGSQAATTSIARTGGTAALPTGGAVATGGQPSTTVPAHDAGAVVDSMVKADKDTTVVEQLCGLNPSRPSYPCENPAVYWRNDAGQYISTPDADMATVLWNCVLGGNFNTAVVLRCPSCINPGTGKIIAPVVECPAQFGHPVCTCNGAATTF